MQLFSSSLSSDDVELIRDMVVRLTENPEGLAMDAASAILITKFIARARLQNLQDLIDYETVKDIIKSYSTKTKPSVLYSYDNQKTMSNDIVESTDTAHESSDYMNPPNLPTIPTLTEQAKLKAADDLNNRIAMLNVEGVVRWQDSLKLLQLNTEYDLRYALLLLRVYVLASSLDQTKP